MQETMPIEVERIIPFAPIEGSNGLAAVLLRVGPLQLWCKIYHDSNGEPFLSMPARKGKDEKFHQSVFFTDRRLHDQTQALVLDTYRKMETCTN